MHHRRRDQLGRTIEVAVALVERQAADPGRGLRGDRRVLVDSPGGRLRREARRSLPRSPSPASASCGWVSIAVKTSSGWSAGFVCVEAALLLLAIQFDPAGAGYRVVVNSRAAAGILVVGACYALAWLHKRLGAHMVARETQIGGLLIVANLLTLSLLTSEINAYWQASGELTASMARRRAAGGGVDRGGNAARLDGHRPPRDLDPTDWRRHPWHRRPDAPAAGVHHCTGRLRRDRQSAACRDGDCDRRPVLAGRSLGRSREAGRRRGQNDARSAGQRPHARVPDKRDHRLLARARRGAPRTNRKPAGPGRYVVAGLGGLRHGGDRRRHPPPIRPDPVLRHGASSPSRS